MNLSRIICEELDNQEFKGIIDMIESNQLDSIALALQVTEANKADIQFKKYFGISLGEYKYIFNNIVLPLSKFGTRFTKAENVVDSILKSNLDLREGIKDYQLYSILSNIPKLAKILNSYMDFDIMSGFDSVELAKEQPSLKKYFKTNIDNYKEYKKEQAIKNRLKK